jgi:hypothetical protein
MKKIKYLFLISILVLTVGCFKSGKEYTYKSANTGEDIKVTISKDYSLSTEEPIKVTKNDQEVASIIFITKTNYDEVKALFADKTLVATKEGTKDNNEFYMYKVSDDYNYIVSIDGANTAAAITSKDEGELNKIADTIKFSK